MRFAFVLLLVLLPFKGAAEPVDDLLAALHAQDISAIMEEEGRSYGVNLDADFLNGEGGEFFASQVAEAYAAKSMIANLRRSLVEQMDAAEIEASLAFFNSAEGAQAIDLELSARRAFMDEAIEAAAGDTYESLKSSKAGKYDAVARFIEVNKLVDLNVRGALSSNYNFYHGMVSGGAYQMTEEQIRSTVYEDADDIRTDTETWVFSYLLMAYGPLSEADLDAYIAYSESDAGQALNTALFAGYDKIFDSISFQLGQAVARALKSAEL